MPPATAVPVATTNLRSNSTKVRCKYRATAHRFPDADHAFYGQSWWLPGSRTKSFCTYQFCGHAEPHRAPLQAFA